MGAVKSVNDGRLGAEQTEVEGTAKGDIQSIREASSVLFLFPFLLCIFKLDKENGVVIESQHQFCVLN